MSVVAVLVSCTRQAIFDYVGSHESTFYELDGEWLSRDLQECHFKRGGQRGEHLRANIDRASVHKFRQFRYIRFSEQEARKRLNTKLFKVQPYPNTTKQLKLV
ncbi:hypothetical protein BU64_30270 [Escherichia coli O128:H2 str. 2011C-3317]|nr:hypothetical protein BU64_30270 [Escherichia coli O128:H2 str. 2011C-3317]